MDWYYRPEIAALVTDWVLYMTPVKGVQEIMQAKADDRASAGDREVLPDARDEPAAVPARGPRGRTCTDKRFDIASYQQYASLFSDVINA